MSTREQVLSAIEDIRAEIAALTLRLGALETQVSSEGFELVGSEAAAASSGVTASDTFASGQSLVQAHLDSERIEAAKQTGQFFLRALTGRPRGQTGRDRVKLQNRYYVVIKTFAGVVHTHPVRVYTAFSSVRAVVAAGGSGSVFGDSIFAGFASIAEAKIAILEAGFTWPSTYS